MTHKKGISVVLIALLGCGFLTNVENTIKPTLLSKKFKEEQIKEFRENKLVEIKFEEKRINHENSNSQLGN